MKLDFAPSQAARWIARAFTCFLLGAALAVILVGCKAPAPHMRPAMSRGIVPDPAAATVVFVRPSSMAGAIRPVIATAQGRFLGESEARSVFVAKLPPGDHLLLSWSEGTPALRATLAAGRVYFVEVAPKMGAWSARVQLLALRPRDENWRELEEWLRKCDAIEADRARLPERRAGVFSILRGI